MGGRLTLSREHTEKEAEMNQQRKGGIMLPIEFRLADHSVRAGVKIVEVYRGKTLVGTIYPHEKGIHFISKYIASDPKQAIEIVPAGVIPLSTILIHLP